MKLIRVTLIMILMTLNINLVFADDNVKTYRFNEEHKLSGVIGNSSKFFYIEENIEVLDAKLNLVFTKSELIDSNYSNITIYVNDIPVTSQKLSGEKIYKNKVEVVIPKDLLKSGYNEIKIKTYKTISDEICRDDNNSGNWLVIHKESNINIKYNFKESKNMISEYERIFSSLNNGTELNSTIVIPDNYNSSELSGGMILSSSIGRKIMSSNYNIDMLKYSDIEDRDKNIIYVGNESNSPSEFSNILNQNEKNKLNKNCIIKIVDSIYNNSKKMILVISNDNDLLIKGCRLLSSSKITKNITGDTIFLDKSSIVEDKIENSSNNRVYIEDLGYENILLKGPFTQEIVFDLNTPKSKIVSAGSKIKINFRYSENIDFERSLATIYINDVPIGSKKLQIDKSNNDILELTLPKEVLNKNYYQVKISFNLNIKDLACVTRDMDTPWAYVDKNSYIEFVYKNNENIHFSSYPYPFVSNFMFNDLSIVVPENMNSKELTDVANIVAYIGQDVKYNKGNFNVVKYSDFKTKSKNLIIIGTPSNNKVIKDINKDLNIKFNKEFSGYENNDDIVFIDKMSSEVASIQLIASPYSNDKDAMVISSTNMNDLNLAKEFITKIDNMKSLKGDTVVLYKNGYIEDLHYNSDLEIEDEKESVFKFTLQGKVFAMVSIFLLITVIISIALLVIRRKKYKK